MLSEESARIINMAKIIAKAFDDAHASEEDKVDALTFFIDGAFDRNCDAYGLSEILNQIPGLDFHHFFNEIIYFVEDCGGDNRAIINALRTKLYDIPDVDLSEACYFFGANRDVSSLIEIMSLPGIDVDKVAYNISKDGYLNPDDINVILSNVDLSQDQVDNLVDCALMSIDYALEGEKANRPEIVNVIVSIALNHDRGVNLEKVQQFVIEKTIQFKFPELALYLAKDVDGVNVKSLMEACDKACDGLKGHFKSEFDALMNDGVVVSEGPSA